MLGRQTGGLHRLLVLASLLLSCGSEVYEGDFHVRTLDDVESLSSYRSVQGAIVVDGEPTVAHIAWPKLESVRDRLVIRNQGQLATLDLPKLTSVGLLIVEDNYQLATIRLPSLRKAGRLVLSGRGVTGLDLPSLTQVDSISVENGRLATLNLPSLQRIGGGDSDPRSSNISQSSALTMLRLPALTELRDGATLMIEGNTALTAIEFPVLARLDGGLSIRDNERLATVDFGALTDVTKSSAVTIFGSPGLIHVHAPRLVSGRDQIHLDLSTKRDARADPSEVHLAERGDLRQLAVASDGDAPLVVLGYNRNDRAVFEGLDGVSGRLRWSTTLVGAPADSAAPVAWSAPTFVNPSTSPTFVTVNIESLGHDLLMEVVALAPSTGQVLWREHGSRSWTSDGVALLMRPRESDGRWENVGKLVAVAGADGSMLEEAVRDGVSLVYDFLDLGDRRGAVLDGDHQNVVVFDANGITGRFTSGMRDTAVAETNELIILCDPGTSKSALDHAHEPLDRVFPCPRLGDDEAEIPIGLQSTLQDVLQVDPRGAQYLATTDGRSPPRALRIGGAAIAPRKTVVPLGLNHGRLVLAVRDEQWQTATQATVLVLTLGSGGDSPSIAVVEGLVGSPYTLEGRWSFLPGHMLGRYLPLVLTTKDEVTHLYLVNVSTARVELTIPIERGADLRSADFLFGRNDEPWFDGLFGFELVVDFMGSVAVWVEARPGEKPEVVAAYQLRGPDGVVAAAQRLDDGQRQPYFYRPHRAFGHGIHVVSLPRGAVRASSDDPKSFGGAIVDIPGRRLVWSDFDNLRLVDMTDVVREIWSAAWLH